MSQTIQAIFENGVLRPLAPLDLPENTIVEVDLKDSMPESINNIQQWIAEFNDWTEDLDPDLPDLSDEQISREIIYGEQLDRQR
jgi:predicted DNA-binding antitoxin AbrB/MazE fold protein